jgi:hypothetical protein
MWRLYTLLALAFIVLICLAAAVLAGGASAVRVPARPRAVAGGAPRGPDFAKSPHLIVDTLNLTHWLQSPAPAPGLALTPALIAATIDRTAPVLRARHPGRIIYVLKDRESRFNDGVAREVYREAAARNGVTICIAERYPDPPAGNKPTEEHSGRGRDDFYMAILAFRLRCAILTADRLRDFARFRATLPPFHVMEFTYWRPLPQRDFIKPESVAYARMRKPRLIHPEAYFADPAAGKNE